MKLLATCVGAVALVSILGFFRPQGMAHFLALMFVLGVFAQMLSHVGPMVPQGSQFGLLVVFWFNLLVFSCPALVLFSLRRRLPRAYPFALLAWTAIYVYSMLLSGRMNDSL